MWKKAVFYLAIASLGLNLAFVGVWGAHAWPETVPTGPSEESGVWCPLHRALKVSPQQWSEIEPRLKEFQASVGVLCNQIDVLRSEVIELIAADRPDRNAIQRKQEEILASKRQIQQLVVEHLLAEREVLTSEQVEQLFTMLRNRTCCAADPPMSGQSRGGLGRVLRHNDATRTTETNR